MWRVSELDESERIRFENIIEMGLGFSTMIRLFKKGSTEELHCQIVKKTAEDIFNAKSREDFAQIHSEFCDWGTSNIFLAEKKRNGRIIKKSKLASYGQIAKTLDVTLKAAVYYSHLPNCERSKRISEWLNAAVDTKMMAMLRKEYPHEIESWPYTIENVDKSNYVKIQKLVRKFIEKKHQRQITPVQFDDIYWNKLNR